MELRVERDAREKAGRGKGARKKGGREGEINGRKD